MIEPPSFISGRAFCTVKKRAPDVAVECFVKMLFRYCAEGSKGAAPGIGDQDVNVSFLIFYLSIQTIEIGQIGDVALNAGDIAADFPDGLVQFVLAAARNKNIGAFRDKPFGRGEAEAAGGVGNNCYFSI